MDDRSGQPPARKHPAFIIRTPDPLNGGPPPDMLARSRITPPELFFVRNHGTVPALDPSDYRLVVGGMVQSRLSLSFEEIRERFPKIAVEATIQCAGNRRDELGAVEPIRHEVAWGAEAISNTVWAGARLRDVLEAAGADMAAGHVAFLGLDEVQRQRQTIGFGGSIPLEKALGSETLLAYEMDGVALPATHGFPLRVVAPGYIGARSVKWVAEITVQAEPSDNYFQASTYKLFPAHVRADTVDWSSGLMLGEMPVTAVICAPSGEASLSAGTTLVHGYAFAGGGRSVERVEISADAGATWIAATLLGTCERWAWRLWEAQVDLRPGARQLIVRAWDTAANTQPSDPAQIWNFKGYMNNAWHRVDVIVEG
jgi:sulfite oxidase